jgi:hypothetical protein
MVIMQHFMTNKEQLEKYRLAILMSWASFKQTLKEKVADFLITS